MFEFLQQVCFDLLEFCQKSRPNGLTKMATELTDTHTIKTPAKIRMNVQLPPKLATISARCWPSVDLSLMVTFKFCVTASYSRRLSLAFRRLSTPMFCYWSGTCVERVRPFNHGNSCSRHRPTTASHLRLMTPKSLT